MTNYERKKVENKCILALHVLETLAHLIKVAGEEFAQSKEGAIAKHLKQTAAHLTQDRQFLFFLTAKKDWSIDKSIAYVKAIEDQIKPKKRITEELVKVKLFIDENIKKGKLLSWDEFQHYEAIAHKVEYLHPDSDLAKFKQRYDDLLIQATRFENTKLAQAIKKGDKTQLPTMVEIEDYRIALAIWKWIAAKFALPTPNPAKVNDFEQKIVAKLKTSVAEFRKEAGLPNDVETENWDNWKAFQTALKKHGKNHPIIKLLDLVGQGAHAKEAILLKQAGGRNSVLEGIKSRLAHMGSEAEIKGIEIAARKELLIRLHEMLQDKILEEKRKEFQKLLNSHAEELEQRLSHNISELRKMKKQLSPTGREMEMALAGGISIAEKAMDLEAKNRKILPQLADLLMIERLGTLFALRQGGSLQQDEFDKKTAALIDQTRTSDAKAAIQWAKHSFETGNVEAANRYIDAAAKRLSMGNQITANNDHIEKKLQPQIKDSQAVLAIDGRIGEKKARDILRKIAKMGLQERYQQQLAPEDLELLKTG